MCELATWKMEGIFKADPNLVAQEITSIGDDFTCSQIVDKARDENTELHKCFEWNDSVAAEKYRLKQAQQVVTHLVIVRQNPDKEPEKTNIRLLVNDGTNTNTYKPIRFVVKKQDEYEQLLEKARAELQAFKRKYSNLSELEEILSLID